MQSGPGRRKLVERTVKNENIDPAIAQKTKSWGCRVLRDKVFDLFDVKMTRFDDASRLEMRRRRRNIRVEATC